MKFTEIEKAIEKKKGIVTIRGWIYRIRKMSDKVFIVLRDSSEIVQCVVKNPELVKIADKLLIARAPEVNAFAGRHVQYPCVEWAGNERADQAGSDQRRHPAHRQPDHDLHRRQRRQADHGPA